MSTPPRALLLLGTLNSLAYGVFVIAVRGTALIGGEVDGRTYVSLFNNKSEVAASVFAVSLWWGRVWVLSTLGMMIGAAIAQLERRE
jgi:hypothetical protein